MGLDGLVDLEGEGEGGAAVFAGDQGSGLVVDSAEEGFDFEAQGLSRGDVRLGEFEFVKVGPHCAASRGRWCTRWFGFDDEEFLACVVDRDILVRLKEAQFADAFGTDAAGGEVGDASGFKLDAHVGNVGRGGKHRQADGADFFNGRFDESEDDIEVMDHEVEDDVDVQRSRGEDAEAVGLKEHGPVEIRNESADGRVEALEVANLQDKIAGVGACDQVVGFGESSRDGLLDEQVQVRAEGLRGDGGVGGGGGADGGGVEGEFAGTMRGETVFDGGEETRRFR